MSSWTEAAIAAALDGKFFGLDGRDKNEISRQLAAEREERKALSAVRKIIREKAAEAIRAMQATVVDGVSPQSIVCAVAAAHGMTPADIVSKSRARHIIRARQHACVLLRELTKMSFPDLCDYVNVADHSTVIHAVKTWRLHELNYVHEDAAARKMLGV